jgi:hypothetical protein
LQNLTLASTHSQNAHAKRTHPFRKRSAEDETAAVIAKLKRNFREGPRVSSEGTKEKPTPKSPSLQNLATTFSHSQTVYAVPPPKGKDSRFIGQTNHTWSTAHIPFGSGVPQTKRCGNRKTQTELPRGTEGELGRDKGFPVHWADESQMYNAHIPFDSGVPQTKRCGNRKTQTELPRGTKGELGGAKEKPTPKSPSLQNLTLASTHSQIVIAVLLPKGKDSRFIGQTNHKCTTHTSLSEAECRRRSAAVIVKPSTELPRGTKGELGRDKGKTYP